MNTNLGDRSSTTNVDQVSRGDGAPPNGHPPENDKNDKNDKNDTGHASRPTDLPPEVYDHLPDTLADVTDCLDQGHERDVFLTGALPVVAGAFPSARLKYGGEWHSVNLFTAIVAPPACGKGVLRDAERLGQNIDERLYDEWQQRKQRWKQRKQDPDEQAGEKPESELFFLPGDSSAAELKRLVHDTPHSVLFDTEFKTVSTAMGQDWGDYRDVLLKSHPNEPLKVGRRGHDLARTQHPALSVALSGTPETFQEIVNGVEDGLFSRFCFYSYDSDVSWKSQFWDDTDDVRRDAIDRAATRLDDIHERLASRDDPLWVVMPDALKKKHTDVFDTALEDLKLLGVSESLIPNVLRAGLAAFRIAALCSLLRVEENGGDLDKAHSVKVTPRDLYAGCLLALAYVRHAFRVAGELSTDDSRDGLHQGQLDYLDELPTGRFDTQDADSIAEEIGVGQRKAQRWRKKFVHKGLLTDLEHGWWERPAERVDDVVFVDRVVSVVFDEADLKMNGHSRLST
jgi:hypothetical protein